MKTTTSKAVSSPLCCCGTGMSVANLAKLSARHDKACCNGALASVGTLRSIFMLDRTSTLGIDGITIVATRSGVGRWVRLPIAHPFWLSQATWFINPAGGNDENVGSTVAGALKTHGELTRRWGTQSSIVVGVDSALNPAKPIKLITVTLLGNLPPSDPIHLKISLGPNTLLAYLGTPRAVRVGSFTQVTQKDRESNTPWEVADAASPIPFSAADVGRRVTITQAANAGSFAWVAKDLGSGLMRMSSFSGPRMPGAPDVLYETELATGAAAVGDLYVVEELTQVTVQSIDIESPVGGPSTNTTIGFANIDFRHTGGTLGSQPNVQGVVTGVFKGCCWDGQLILMRHGLRHHYLNCRFGALALNLAGSIFRSGLCLGTIADRGGITTFDNDFMVQGGNGLLIQVSGALLGTVCVFDSAVDGFRIGAGDGLPSTAACISLPGSAEHHLWGAGNVGAGLAISGGSVLNYQATTPTVTGGMGDFLLGGAVQSRAWYEPLSTYTELRDNIWKKFKAPIVPLAVPGPVPGPGFGGNAHNVERNAHIVLR